MLDALLYKDINKILTINIKYLSILIFDIQRLKIKD